MAHEKFDEMVEIARRHLDGLRRFGRQDLGAMTLYEFGAGWDLIVPVAFYSFGVNRQILVDVRRLFAPRLVSHTIDRFSAARLDWPPPRRPARTPLLVS